MPKSAESVKPVNKDRYWSGVFTGVFIGGFFIATAILVFIRFQGLEVAINPEQLAKLVQSKVQHEAKNDVPTIFEDLKKQLPDEVSSHLGELDDVTIGIGKSQVKLPQEVITGVKTEFTRVIEEAVMNTLNDYNTGKYEERMGQNAYDLVNTLLRQELIGKTYLIPTTRWFSLPIKIVGTSNQQFRVGI